MPGINNRLFKFMPYLIKIPQEQMKDLWRLREYAGKGPIVMQAREAISDYLRAQEKQLGAPVEDIEQVMERHKRESS